MHMVHGQCVVTLPADRSVGRRGNGRVNNDILSVHTIPPIGSNGKYCGATLRLRERLGKHVLPMRPELLKGHLDALLLAVLESGPQHGYAVIEALRARSAGALDLPTGTVYPALHRLERARLITSEWHTVGGRRRRAYRLTPAGHAALGEQRAVWDQFSTAVTALLARRAWPATT
jgi:PadR family transcriptional regulator PadR